MKDFMQENMDEFLPLREVVFKTLRQSILTGELKPGERLMEIHLAEKLGVSRTPIREAIRKLELPRSGGCKDLGKKSEGCTGSTYLSGFTCGKACLSADHGRADR